jgi:hypothetical protein
MSFSNKPRTVWISLNWWIAHIDIVTDRRGEFCLTRKLEVEKRTTVELLSSLIIFSDALRVAFSIFISLYIKVLL